MSDNTEKKQPIKKTNEEKLDEQFHPWRDYLNHVIGVLAFSFALGSLGTNSPSTNAFISFLFILAMIKCGPFPQILEMLEAKENRTQTEENSRQTILKNKLGKSTLFSDHLIYFLGWIALALVMASTPSSKYCPLIATYVNGDNTINSKQLNKIEKLSPSQQKVLLQAINTIIEGTEK